MLRPYRITHVTTQYLRVRSGGPRMARPVLPVCVARNDGEWTVYRHGDHLLRVGMNHDWPADPAVPLEALAIQPLARPRPFQLGQSLSGSGSISVLDGGGLNLRHPGIIRIRLRCQDRKSVV